MGFRLSWEQMNLQVTKNRDNTVTVRVGRAVEHVSLEGKTKAQVFDAVKYAAISKGAVISNIMLTEILNDAAK